MKHALTYPEKSVPYSFTEEQMNTFIERILNEVVTHLAEKEPHRTLTARRLITPAMLQFGRLQ